MADRLIVKPAQSAVSTARPAFVASESSNGSMKGLALVGLVASMMAGLFILYTNSDTVFLDAPHIPEKSKPSDEFPANYQNDPLAHIAHAITLDKAGKVFAAEVELRDALALADKDPESQTIREHARTLLAVVMFKDGRRWDAWQMAGDLCRGAPRLENRRLLDEAKVCD